MNQRNVNDPNIIIITTDQQRRDSLSCYGSDFTSTPHIDRLAAGGVVCDRAYTPNPVCTPARASLFSGQYMSRHGAWNVGMNLPEDTPMLSHRCNELGYQTHYIGKAHFQAYMGRKQPLNNGSTAAELGSKETRQADWESRFADWNGPYYGFDRVELCHGHSTGGLGGHYGLWVKEQAAAAAADFDSLNNARPLSEAAKFGGRALDWDLPVAWHNSVWTAERSIDFLKKKRAAAAPFLLAIGFQDPHHPHAVPTDFDDRIDPADVPLPRYQHGELDDKPPHFGLAHRGEIDQSEFRGDYPIAGQGSSAGDIRSVSEIDARQGRAYYYSMVKLIDQQVGRILQCLEEEGLADNTIVIFTSDHGELLGDHGLWMKGPFHYEELVRIPLIVRWPQGGVSGGRRLSGLCSLVDLVPSVLAALGQRVPDECDGVDAMPLLRGESDAVRAHSIVECTDDPLGLRLKTVVTENRKLTYYHGYEFGELYDLELDPGELVNRWSDPTYNADRQQLMAILIDHAERLEKRVERLCYA